MSLERVVPIVAALLIVAGCRKAHQDSRYRHTTLECVPESNSTDAVRSTIQRLTSITDTPLIVVANLALDRVGLVGPLEEHLCLGGLSYAVRPFGMIIVANAQATISLEMYDFRVPHRPWATAVVDISKGVSVIALVVCKTDGILELLSWGPNGVRTIVQASIPNRSRPRNGDSYTRDWNIGVPTTVVFREEGESRVVLCVSWNGAGSDNQAMIACDDFIDNIGVGDGLIGDLDATAYREWTEPVWFVRMTVTEAEYGVQSESASR